LGFDRAFGAGTARYINHRYFWLRTIRVSASDGFGQQSEVLSHLSKIHSSSIFWISPTARASLLMDNKQNAVPTIFGAQISAAQLVHECHFQLAQCPAFGDLDLDRNARIVRCACADVGLILVNNVGFPFDRIRPSLGSSQGIAHPILDRSFAAQTAKS
jgi:hypothetical protein